MGSAPGFQAAPSWIRVGHAPTVGHPGLGALLTPPCAFLRQFRASTCMATRVLFLSTGPRVEFAGPSAVELDGDGVENDVVPVIPVCGGAVGLREHNAGTARRSSLDPRTFLARPITWYLR
jgi:hypothetical protein